MAGLEVTQSTSVVTSFLPLVNRGDRHALELYSGRDTFHRHVARRLLCPRDRESQLFLETRLTGRVILRVIRCAIPFVNQRSQIKNRLQNALGSFSVTLITWS